MQQGSKGQPWRQRPITPLRRVLVVDDEKDILESVRDLLESEFQGIEVVTALGGEAALAMVDNEVPTLMLTDFRMPGMDGIHLVEAMKESHPEVPIIMMTAYAELGIEEAARCAGVATFMNKPFWPQALLDAVSTGLAAGR